VERCLLLSVGKGVNVIIKRVHKLIASLLHVNVFWVIMCHDASQSAFLHTQLYLSTNLDSILFSNVSWH